MPTFETGYCAQTQDKLTLITAPNYPSVSSTYPPPIPGGTHCFNHGWKATAICPRFTWGSSGWTTVHMLVRFTVNLSPATPCKFLNCEDVTGACIALQIAASPWTGRVEVTDKNGTVVGGTAGGTVELNKWYAIDLKFQHTSSTIVHMWLREAWTPPKRYLALSGVNATSGGTNGTFYSFNGVSMGIGFHCPHIIVLTDTGTAIYDDHTCGIFRYPRVYGNTTQGAAGDDGSGHNLDNSTTWAMAAEIPGTDAVRAEFHLDPFGTNTKYNHVHANDGTRTGPSGDTLIGPHDSITGALYAGRVRSYQGVPSGRKVDYQMIYGSNTSRSTSAYWNDLPAAWNQNSNKHKMLDGSHADCPTLAEYASQGMRMKGGTMASQGWLAEQAQVVFFERPHLATVDGFITHAA